MKRAVLIINRHGHGVLFDGERCLVPLDFVEPHLLTHSWGGLDGLDSTAFPHSMCTDMRDEGHLELLSKWMINNANIRHIVALHENTVSLAANLRTYFRMEGLGREAAEFVRDKVKMKERIFDSGVRVPAFAALDMRDDLMRMPWGSGRKVIKPRAGVGSQGVVIVNTIEDAQGWWDATEPASGIYEIEEYIEGTMYHCDAIVLQREIVFAAASEYLERPGNFGPGRMAGSMRLQESDLATQIVSLTREVVESLGICDSAVHLELFRRTDGELIFLELGARPGGGGIDRYIFRSNGVHMFEAAIRVQCGLRPLSSDALIVDGAVWGVVGFYPGPLRGAVCRESFESLGISEYARFSTGTIPRHCTDYRDRYVLSANSRDEFLRKVEGLRSAYYSGNAPKGPEGLKE